MQIGMVTDKSAHNSVKRTAFSLQIRKAFAFSRGN